MSPLAVRDLAMQGFIVSNIVCHQSSGVKPSERDRHVVVALKQERVHQCEIIYGFLCHQHGRVFNFSR